MIRGVSCLCQRALRRLVTLLRGTMSFLVSWSYLRHLSLFPVVAFGLVAESCVHIFTTPSRVFFRRHCSLVLRHLPFLRRVPSLCFFIFTECQVPHFDAHPTPVNVSIRPKNIPMPQSGKSLEQQPTLVLRTFEHSTRSPNPEKVLKGYVSSPWWLLSSSCLPLGHASCRYGWGTVRL